jgi:L-amino acid N-acyltransferase YncA
VPAEVRPARPQDAPRIAEIYSAGIAERSSTFETDPRTTADVLAWLEAGKRLPVLVAGEDSVLGWARITAYSDRAAYAGVGEVSIYVDPEARGRGMGTGLLEELSRRARELGYWKLTGKLFPENEASVRLVRRNGWREVGLHLRHGRLDGEWRDVLVVERLLDQAPARGSGSDRSEGVRGR